MPSAKPHFCPMPYRYGVVRVNVFAMVADLDDPIALEEAKSMQTGDYLVYLREELELPFPGRPWFRFTMSPIGADLRVEEKELAITRSMCVPIYPNTVHPRNREPVRTIPEFPIPNCYHWLATDIDIRIRAKPDDETFDDSCAIRLPAEERLSLSYHWGEDLYRRHKLLVRRQKAAHAAEQVTQPSTGQSTTEPGSPSRDRDVASLRSDDSSIHPSEYSNDESSEYSGSYCSDDSYGLSVDDPEDSISDSPDGEPDIHDVFAGQSSMDEMLPLVDFSFELDKVLNAETFPNPVKLLEECEVAIAIVARSRARKCAASEPVASQGSPVPLPSEPNDAATPPCLPNKRRPGFRPVKVMRRVGMHAVTIMRSVQDKLRLSRLVFWV
ncbi:hypothetical protein FKP32DRAFT_1097849 [Trametes sanguinea]|nr:hypothetical protein FKP32DRAFT_1097849 [Trametes sanguinea]